MIQMTGAQLGFDKVYIHTAIDIHTGTRVDKYVVSFVLINCHKSELILTCNTYLGTYWNVHRSLQLVNDKHKNYHNIIMDITTGDLPKQYM